MKYPLLLLMTMILCGCRPDKAEPQYFDTNEPTERFVYSMDVSEDYRPFTVMYEMNPTGTCYLVFVSTNGNELRIDMPRTNYLWFMDNPIRWQ